MRIKASDGVQCWLVRNDIPTIEIDGQAIKIFHIPQKTKFLCVSEAEFYLYSVGQSHDWPTNFQFLSQFTDE